MNSDVREQNNEECHRLSLNHLMPPASMSHKVWITARSYCHCWYLSQMPSRCSQRTCSCGELRCDNPTTVWHLNGEKKNDIWLWLIQCSSIVSIQSTPIQTMRWQMVDKTGTKVSWRDGIKYGKKEHVKWGKGWKGWTEDSSGYPWPTKTRDDERAARNSAEAANFQWEVDWAHPPHNMCQNIYPWSVPVTASGCIWLHLAASLPSFPKVSDTGQDNSVVIHALINLSGNDLRTSEVRRTKLSATPKNIMGIWKCLVSESCLLANWVMHSSTNLHLATWAILQTSVMKRGVVCRKHIESANLVKKNANKKTEHKPMVPHLWQRHLYAWEAAAHQVDASRSKSMEMFGNLESTTELRHQIYQIEYCKILQNVYEMCTRRWRDFSDSNISLTAFGSRDDSDQNNLLLLDVPQLCQHLGRADFMIVSQPFSGHRVRPWFMVQ